MQSRHCLPTEMKSTQVRLVQSAEVCEITVRISYYIKSSTYWLIETNPSHMFIFM
ncbi:hypothetical protein HanPSC8_Chr10g0428811 [Helianthus annuus]|nr:hypothetical protein HanPSC8_Chr10g0428811 [Helianthus annuus]